METVEMEPLEWQNMDKLKILEVASEVAPFARTGGLGDVLGALPKALVKRGHEVKVVLPRYQNINALTHNLTKTNIEFSVNLAGKQHECKVESSRNTRLKIDTYFISNEGFFGRPQYYLDPETGLDYIDNDERFIFFNRAVIELIRKLGWKPDLIHVHDWQSALIPAYLRTVLAGDEFFHDVKSVLTIHNLGYQGLFPGERFSILGLPGKMFYSVTGAFEYFGKVNFLKGGITCADYVTTVSERYASEIQSGDEFGCGLQGVLKERSSRLTGILNGVDYSVWSPTRDKNIQYHFTLSNLSGKKKNKIELLNNSGLPIREKSPLIGIVSRLTDQKGWDIIVDAFDQLFAMNVQVIILGNGDAQYHDLLTTMEKKYSDKLKAYLTFNDSLAHQIEAGADMFLMPSRWEPCGLNQMYSLRYGTVPIVREVGGLADTVKDFNPDTLEGTGFVFKEYSVEAMLEAVTRAVNLFAHKRIWTGIMKAGMTQDYSWEISAQKYEQLFSRIIND
jgi:starch synthase